jgi:NitT/TauT family transport system permease protein
MKRRLDSSRCGCTALFFLVDYAERRRLLLPWHVSQRARHERSAERG